MWFSVLKRELNLQEKFAGSTVVVRTGGVYKVSKHLVDGVVGVRAVHIDELEKVMYFSPEEARGIFTTPTKSLDSALEESFMICEAVYC
jgi:hypothetical protein